MTSSTHLDFLHWCVPAFRELNCDLGLTRLYRCRMASSWPMTALATDIRSKIVKLSTTNPSRRRMTTDAIDGVLPLMCSPQAIQRITNGNTRVTWCQVKPLSVIEQSQSVLQQPGLAARFIQQSHEGRCVHPRSDCELNRLPLAAASIVEFSNQTRSFNRKFQDATSFRVIPFATVQHCKSLGKIVGIKSSTMAAALKCGCLIRMAFGTRIGANVSRLKRVRPVVGILRFGLVRRD